MMWRASRGPGVRVALVMAGALLVGGFLVFTMAPAHLSLAGGNAADDRGAGAVPAVAAPTVEFERLDGEAESLAGYRGQVVVLNVWGTWCPPCVREIPHLVEVHGAIEPRGGVVVGLAVDSGTPDEIRGFWNERIGVAPAYPIWIGTNHEARAHLDAFGLPNTLIVDREGMIRERFLGVVTREELLEALEAYL